MALGQECKSHRDLHRPLGLYPELSPTGHPGGEVSLFTRKEHLTPGGRSQHWAAPQPRLKLHPACVRMCVRARVRARARMQGTPRKEPGQLLEGSAKRWHGP